MATQGEEVFSVSNFFQKHSLHVKEKLLDSFGAKLTHLADQSELLPLKWSEIGDGNINFVYRVWIGSKGSETNDSTVVIKYAPSYIRCLGPAYLLTQERLQLEYEAMCTFHELRPFCVPAPLLYDKESSAVLMEDLTGFEVMRANLIKGVVDISAINNVMTAISTIHSNTTKQGLGEEEHSKMCQTFKNVAMVGITDQYVFTKPYLRDDETNRHHPLLNEVAERVRSNKGACERAEKMKKLFLESCQCLCHGDLHTGSVMNLNDKAKMFDLEFAFMGPATFDFGMFLANLIFAIIRHHIMKNTVIVETLCQALMSSVKTYQQADVKGLICCDENFNADTCGFIGCELIRRVIGTAHVGDIESLPEGELICLELGEQFLMLEPTQSEDIIELIISKLKVILQ